MLLISYKNIQFESYRELDTLGRERSFIRRNTVLFGKWWLLDDLEHRNSDSYANRQVFIVAMKDYVYYGPYVETQDEIFLKAIIPRRKLT